ncbi:hypothetical protein BDZ89DRAFT_1240185, partial [Hymenopellis radicata]
QTLPKSRSGSNNDLTKWQRPCRHSCIPNFALFISTASKASRRAIIEQCSEFILNGHDFNQDLALCAVQMYGVVRSAALDSGTIMPSLAAGLPHFAVVWARCWARVVAISLRGFS